LDRLEPLAYLAWPPSLLCAQAGLQPVRSFSVMPKRQSFPANGFGAEIRENGGLMNGLTRLGRSRPRGGDDFHSVPLFDGCAGIVFRAFLDPRQKALQDQQVHFARL
jgi:hypothetical protein